MGTRVRHGARESLAVKAPSRLWKAATLAFGVTWLAALVRWWPLTRFPVWGSDQGEYGNLLGTFLATGGTMPDAYTGWGGGYPDFQGMYIFAGSVAQATGIDSFLVLSVLIPAVAGFTALFAFVIALRLSRSLLAATVAGLIAATAMPEVYAGSHGMPGAFGGMLALAVVAAAVFAVRTPAFRWVLVVIALALIPTHHLSAFLAAVMLACAALLEARVAPADAERSRAVDACLLGASTLLLLSAGFWSWGAPHFRGVVIDHTSPTLGRILPGLALLGVAGLVVVTYYFETLPRLRARSLRIVDDRRMLRRVALAGVGTLGVVGFLATVGVPGTSAVVPVAVALPFVPLGFTIAAVAIGPGRLAPVRGALIPLGAVLGVIVSALIGIVFLPTVLFPYRHLQYFVDAAAPLAGVGLAFAAKSVMLQALPGRRALARTGAAALLAALILGCAFTAYPSKEAVVGFQEGTTDSEAAAVLWLDWNVPTTLVASDHRLSSIVYGFAHQDATWEAGGAILVGDGETAKAALATVRSPSGQNNATVVLISSDLKEGAALSQWEPATPIPPAGLEKFLHAPFVRVFDNGDAVAYWVAR
jgi:hypothetical protein